MISTLPDDLLHKILASAGPPSRRAYAQTSKSGRKAADVVTGEVEKRTRDAWLRHLPFEPGKEPKLSASMDLRASLLKPLCKSLISAPDSKEASHSSAPQNPEPQPNAIDHIARLVLQEKSAAGPKMAGSSIEQKFVLFNHTIKTLRSAFPEKTLSQSVDEAHAAKLLYLARWSDSVGWPREKISLLLAFPHSESRKDLAPEGINPRAVEDFVIVGAQQMHSNILWGYDDKHRSFLAARWSISDVQEDTASEVESPPHYLVHTYCDIHPEQPDHTPSISSFSFNQNAPLPRLVSAKDEKWRSIVEIVSNVIEHGSFTRRDFCSTLPHHDTAFIARYRLGEQPSEAA